MRRIPIFFSTFIALLICIGPSLIASGQESSQIFIDERDGMIYKTIGIGKQIWMAENLNYETDSSWCYNDSITNCHIYGRLYNWKTAKRACPAGWHLPADMEFVELINNSGGYDKAGLNLKESDTTHWKYPNTGVTNKSRFTALPGGIRQEDGTYTGLGYFGSWWSSTEARATLATSRDLYNYEERIIARFDSNKNQGLSVRCVKD